MLQTRIIPFLLIKNGKLVKTVKFKKPEYIWDPVNAIKIFNEKEVDEIIVLDISASIKNSEPDYKFIKRIADECFMPVCYGGGITNIDQIRKIFEIGIEKISINSILYRNINILEQASKLFGNQCIVASVDIKKDWLGQYNTHFYSGEKKAKIPLADFLKQIVDKGAGEILLNNIDAEGTWRGFDLELLNLVANSVKVPVIAMGGAGNLEHISDALSKSKVSAIALGSMAVYQKQGMGVLINFPSKEFQNDLNNIQHYDLHPMYL
jgi:cyclase